MKDPTRIPKVMAALQDLWEALPDLEFADVLRLLEGEGFEQVDDAVAVDKLRALGERFPRTLGEGVRVADVGEWFVTADAHRVVVWSYAHPPASWEYERLVSAQVGYPLHAVDRGGEHRRFGVVERIRPVAAEKIAQDGLPELARDTIGDDVYLVESEDTKALIGRSLHIFETGRRETTQQRRKWTRALATELGGDLTIDLSSGAGKITISNITAIYRLR